MRNENVRMGTLKQLRPMRSSPLLQQASFWPLPHFSESAEWSTLTSVALSEPPWAKATAATEAMTRVLKKAILIELGWLGWSCEGSECELIGLLDDGEKVAVGVVSERVLIGLMVGVEALLTALLCGSIEPFAPIA